MAKKKVDFEYYFYLSLAILFGLYFAFVLYLNFGCKFKKTITIGKIISSYRSGKYGLNLLSDTNGNVYVVRNSIFQMFFRGPELYSMLEENKTYEIKGYGFRNEYIGLYPNITYAREISQS